MALTIKDCFATAPGTITVVFSEPVDIDSAVKAENYQIAKPPVSSSTSLAVGSVNIVIDSTQTIATITVIDPSLALSRGNWIQVTVKVKAATTNAGDPVEITTFAQVDARRNDEAKEMRRTTRAVEDAVSYPVLTEDVGLSTSSRGSTPGMLSTSSGAAPLGQTITKAMSDVLGWKIKSDDPKGFVGALNASFTCNTVGGHTEVTWSPRSYAVQTDLSGGITGAQASIYSRAKDALDQALPLLEGLYSLDPEAVAEDVSALRAVTRSQLTELVNELGLLGGPRVSRVNQYFALLLGAGTFPASPVPSMALGQTDPDLIGGTLGNLRDELGLNFTKQDFVNSVEDEQDLSNFRILSDYVTSLAQSWINNLAFFGLATTTPFFGTQLVLLSRQLSVIAESVDEVRFTLDSVFIGPAERQTLQLNFAGDPPMFIEDLLAWIQGFAAEEGPRLIQDGGKFGVQNTFFPVADRLQRLVHEAQGSNPANAGLPRGFHTSRVQRALQELGGELQELVRLAKPIRHTVTPEPEFILPLAVTAVEPNSIALPSANPTGTLLPLPVSIHGSGFDTGAKVTFKSGKTELTVKAYFRSDRLLVADLATAVPSPPNAWWHVGSWDVVIENSVGGSASLRGGFTVTRAV